MMFEKIAPDSHIQGDNKKDIQAPRSPEGPPPGSSSMFAPRSPEGPPPGSSSMFAPRSPEGPPPGSSSMFAPRSPEGPPPGSSSMFAPRSPEGLPPEGGVDEEDASLVRILKIREIAIRMAGGEDLWDELDEDDVDIFKERAELELDSYS
jgi:hypothetical protein